MSDPNTHQDSSPSTQIAFHPEEFFSKKKFEIQQYVLTESNSIFIAVDLQKSDWKEWLQNILQNLDHLGHGKGYTCHIIPKKAKKQNKNQAQENQKAEKKQQEEKEKNENMEKIIPKNQAQENQKAEKKQKEENENMEEEAKKVISDLWTTSIGERNRESSLYISKDIAGLLSQLLSNLKAQAESKKSAQPQTTSDPKEPVSKQEGNDTAVTSSTSSTSSSTIPETDNEPGGESKKGEVNSGPTVQEDLFKSTSHKTKSSVESSISQGNIPTWVRNGVFLILFLIFVNVLFPSINNPPPNDQQIPRHSPRISPPRHTPKECWALEEKLNDTRNSILKCVDQISSISDSEISHCQPTEFEPIIPYETTLNQLEIDIKKNISEFVQNHGCVSGPFTLAKKFSIEKLLSIGYNIEKFKQDLEIAQLRFQNCTQHAS